MQRGRFCDGPSQAQDHTRLIAACVAAAAAFSQLRWLACSSGPLLGGQRTLIAPSSSSRGPAGEGDVSSSLPGARWLRCIFVGRRRIGLQPDKKTNNGRPQVSQVSCCSNHGGQGVAHCGRAAAQWAQSARLPRNSVHGHRPAEVASRSVCPARACEDGWHEGTAGVHIEPAA